MESRDLLAFLTCSTVLVRFIFEGLEAITFANPNPAGMESRDLLAYLGGLGAGVREITKGENSANYMMEGENSVW